ncbi:MAG: hypothetical protein HYT08_02705 [Candidatus Levybacteria bacterium]|nr:hypothetical protein [Candidatus Levybacteria bacterium]
MKEFFNDIKNDRVFIGGFSLAFVLILLSTIYVLLSYTKIPPYIPLFNQLPWGYDRLGTRLMIFLPIALAFTTAIGNIIFSSIIYRKTQIVSRMLAATGLIVAFLSFLFIVRTIQLVI